MVPMASGRLKTDKYEGKSDFSIWRIKMEAVLVQNKLLSAIKKTENYPKSWKDKDLEEKLDSAKSIIILHLQDNVIREIRGFKTAKDIWLNLENMSLRHSTLNKIYLKEQFSFKMSPSKSLEDNLDD